jgi:hypothetical protein
VTKIDKQEPFVVHGDIQGRDDRNDQIWPWKQLVGDVGVDDHTAMKQ